MKPEEKTELEDAETVFRRLLDWNIEDREGTQDVQGKLAEVLGRTGYN